LFLFSVSLTKTSAKGKDLKKTLIQTLRGALDEYKDVYVMSFHNMRPSLFKDVRMDWRESRYISYLSVRINPSSSIISYKNIHG
jgi:hypothetical protein